MKILVTGGCGFVGANICLAFKKSNKVFSLDNLSRKSSVLNFEILKKKELKIIKLIFLTKKKFKN